MASRPFIRSIKIRNYRSLRSFEINEFKRINIIGGLNGSGKTTLLESIFTFMDRFGPLGVLRPFIFRQIPAGLQNAKYAFFSGEENHFEISCITRDGLQAAVYRWESQPAPKVVSVPPIESTYFQESTSRNDGITLESTTDGDVVLIRHMIDTGSVGSISLNDELKKVQNIPLCAILSRFTMHNQQDIANRFSSAIQSGDKNYLINIVKGILPEVSGLELLSVGGQIVLHAEISRNKIVPLSFIGDGAMTLLSVCLAIMECKGGVLLLDEFDAAIHYSRLEHVWGVIGDSALKFDCQVFSATHSLESINAAARAYKNRNKKDLNYLRLDKIDNNIVVTSYDYELLSRVEEDEWEVR